MYKLVDSFWNLFLYIGGIKMVDKVSIPLAKLIFDYIKQKRDIDKSFIDKVIEIVVTNLNINDYVRGARIINNPWEKRKAIEVANYNYRTKIITIELQAAIEFYTFDLKRINLNDSERFAIIYNCIMQTILHELEHANQWRKVDAKEPGLETRLIADSNTNIKLASKGDWFDKLLAEGYPECIIYSYLKKQSEINWTYWDYAPYERLAEYYSHTTMATIFKEIGSFSGISYYECLMLCQSYLRGYMNGIVPTKFYFDKIGASNFYIEIENEGNNLDFESRAAMGLPISKDEYNNLYSTTSELENLIIR